MIDSTPNPTPNPSVEAQPNSSPPSTPPLSENASPPLSAYPNFIQQPTPNPLSTDQHALNDRGMALRRLGVTEADVANVPRITSRVREAVGTVKSAIRILKGDDALDSIAFMTKWNSLSAKDQARVRLEDVIVAAGLTPRRFMELLAGASMDHSAIVSKLIVSHNQPKVLKATVKAAIDSVPIMGMVNGESVQVGSTNGDVKAMEMFHKITGALPTPKGANFTFNQQINKGEDQPKQQTPLESMDSFLLELDEVRKPKQLEAGRQHIPIIPVEMPDNAPEIEYLDLHDV